MFHICSSLRLLKLPFEDRFRALNLRFAICLVAISVYCTQGFAEDEIIFIETDDILAMDLDELLNIQITSVSRKEEDYWTTPAAITVLTAEKIKESGALSLPEALRLSPGFNMGQFGPTDFSTGMRGFSEQISNKLLVLVDGRSIYTPAFSGVFWPGYQLPLETIERIEVVRGPGGSIWGANAVSGIVNIVTKDAHDTLGTLTSFASGTEKPVEAFVRHGFKTGERGVMNIWTSYDLYDDTLRSNGTDADNEWDSFRMGTRYDLDLSDDTKLTLDAGGFLARGGSDVADVSLATAGNNPINVQYQEAYGAHVLGEWNRTFSSQSALRLQAYVDHFRYISTTFYDYHVTSWDIELQHNFPIGDRHDISWGGGYRLNDDHTQEGLLVKFTPRDDTQHIANVFFQDQIAIVPDQLELTLGTKLEWNSYTDVEIQPTARVSWYPTRNWTAWAAVSRAVRTPSRLERDSVVNFATVSVPVPLMVQLIGNEALESEELIAYELGFRGRLMERMSLDFAAYLYDYDKLIKVEPLGAPTMGTQLIQPVFQNNTNALNAGFEIALNYLLSDQISLSLQYSYLNIDMDFPGVSQFDEEGSTPHNTITAQMVYDITNEVQVGLSGRFVDELTSIPIDSYCEIDARLGWKPRENVEFSLVGKNLLDASHQESSLATTTTMFEIERAIYAELSLEF